MSSHLAPFPEIYVARGHKTGYVSSIKKTKQSSLLILIVLHPDNEAVERGAVRRDGQK